MRQRPPHILNDVREIYEGYEGLRAAVLRFLGNAVKSNAKELLLYSDQNMEWMVEDPSFRLKLYEIASAFHTVWSAEGVASLRQLCNRDMIRIGSGYNIDERRRVLSDMAIALHASLT